MSKFNVAVALLLIIASVPGWAKTKALAACNIVLLNTGSQNSIEFTKHGEAHDLLPQGQSVQWSAQLSDDGKSLKITHFINLVAPTELESMSLPLNSGASFEIKQTTFSDSVAPYSFVCKSVAVGEGVGTSGLRNDSGDLLVEKN